jgi:hypothetical protein
MTGHRLMIRVNQQRRDRQTKGTSKPFLYETCHSLLTCNLKSKQNKLVFMIKKIWGVARIKQEWLQHVPDWCIAPMFAEDIEVSRKIVEYLGCNCFSNMVKWESIVPFVQLGMHGAQQAIHNRLVVVSKHVTCLPDCYTQVAKSIVKQDQSLDWHKCKQQWIQTRT